MAKIFFKIFFITLIILSVSCVRKPSFGEHYMMKLEKENQQMIEKMMRTEDRMEEEDEEDRYLPSRNIYERETDHFGFADESY